MASTLTVLIPSKLAEAFQVAQYIAVTVTTTIDKFTITNISLSVATISVNLVKATSIPGTENIILKNHSVPPGESYTCPELVGHILLPGGFISTIANSASSLVIRASGREIS